MNALTPHLEAQLLSSSVQPIGCLPMEMSSNIGRDVKIRGSEFRTFEAAMFEYVVNAYEGYNLDQTPVIDINVKGLKATISDNGVGMNLEILARYWMMHAGTIRRINGRNKRGYYGSGKSAFYRIAHRILVETIRDGFKNSMFMDSADVDAAAAEGRAPRVHPLLVQQPTDEPNGTKITLHLKTKPTALEMRALHQKVSENLRFVMNGAVVTINGQQVEPRPVSGTVSTVNSICGAFNATFTYNDGGHHEDDSKVFYKVGGCYIAAEQTGKEGHRLSHRVMVEVDTSDAWALEHFEDRREHFMSESRDLRLNANDPAAKELRDFAEYAVREFMKKLEDEEAKRRKDEMSEERKKLLEKFSRVFGAMMSFGGPLPHEKTAKGQVEVVEPVEERTPSKRSGRGSNGNRNPKPTFDFQPFESLAYHYELQPEVNTIVFNTNSPALKAILQDDATRQDQQLIWSLAAQAVAEMETQRFIDKQAEDGIDVSVSEAMTKHKDLLAAIHNRLADQYRACLV